MRLEARRMERPMSTGAEGRVSYDAHSEINGHLVSIYQFLCGVIFVQAVTICGLIAVVRYG